ncbi:hypothetical protein CHH77_15110 [Shouchella clausii]|uniref:DUF6602 domain-containing protein n=1 Tax=Shouchella clausii TaxID=79880 RepID=UPI000BA7A2C7|nr:DUF6602 domain-containing protein [Shouchella clausii]PAE81093.1 hypothetical protein CHH77_15110 [Shouchella clausii]
MYKKSKRKKATPQETIRGIAENYKRLEKSHADQLGIQAPNHDASTGSYRENIWLDLFKRIIPKKFCISTGVFIMDSYQNVSKEVDIAIYDEQYTPYIFTDKDRIKYIPIEAVAVAIQCKSEKINNDDIRKWAQSITELKTSLNALTRIQTSVLDTNLDNLHSFYISQQERKNKGVYNQEPMKQMQTSTRPILILCKLNGSKTKLADTFDIVLSINQKEVNQKGEPYQMSKQIKYEKEDLSYWYNQLNHFQLGRYGEEEETKLKEIANVQMKEFERNLYQLRVVQNDEENITLSLTFQLNQLLMLINNPIFFPHQSYVCMFNKILNQGDGSDGSN